jgi:hypothetical protein
MTNTITLGNPPAPKQPRSVEEMKPGQIVVWIDGDKTRAAVRSFGARHVVTFDSGFTFDLFDPLSERADARVLLPGETITITVGE